MLNDGISVTAMAETAKVFTFMYNLNPKVASLAVICDFHLVRKVTSTSCVRR